MTAVLLKVLIFHLISSVHVVQPQLSQAQPCLICGDAVLRIWSLMSRQGDKYMRITNRQDAGNNNHQIVDCGGGLQNDNFTSLLQVRERSTFDETRLQLVLARDNKRYHLYAPSASGELLAMPASEGEQQTDHRNTWAPERLRYEHQLFTVFQSVKYRGYYLSCDGSGKAVLQQIINIAYREPNQLFLTIDPGNAIRGVTFGSSNAAGRRKREISTQDGAYSDGGFTKDKWRRNRYKIRQPYKKRPYHIPRPKPYYHTYTKKPPTTPPPQYSSVVTKFKLPQNITFVLCFWIKTETKFAQLISVTEDTPQEKTEETAEILWRTRYPYGKKTKQTKSNRENNIINVSINRGMLRLQVGYKRTTRTLRNCDITDGKFHQICISLNQDYLLEVYRDSKVVRRDSLPGVACDFQGCNGNRGNRRGTFMLGRNQGVIGERFDGSLFQVNLWDQYPSFRIRRIATNCACGGGTLVSWTELLNATMSNVNLDNNSACPTLEGYNYDELTQNRLI